jgi:hypothetical protein
MHDVSVLAAELVVAPGESTAQDNVEQAKDLSTMTNKSIFDWHQLILEQCVNINNKLRTTTTTTSRGSLNLMAM